MKQLLSLVILIVLFSCKTNTQNLELPNCLPDMGIKSAKIFTERLNADFSATEDTEATYLESEFDRQGRMVKSYDSVDESYVRREFEGDSLVRIVLKYKEDADFNFQSEKASQENTTYVINTSKVIENYANGAPRKLLGYDGNIIVYHSDSCDDLLQTLMSPEGDTIHQFTSKSKNGLLYETIWAPFNPVKSERLTTFSD